MGIMFCILFVQINLRFGVKFCHMLDVVTLVRMYYEWIGAMVVVHDKNLEIGLILGL